MSLTLAGFVTTGAYFVYQMSGNKRKISVELLLALVASIALGFGSLFLMLSFDLYV